MCFFSEENKCLTFFPISPSHSVVFDAGEPFDDSVKQNPTIAKGNGRARHAASSSSSTKVQGKKILRF
jgi:hypothetical protein